MTEEGVGDLERWQRGLLALMKRREWPEDDPYLCTVAGSAGLVMLRKITHWWTKVLLEAQCRYTSRLLKRFDEFDGALADFCDGYSVSPFIEDRSLDFLCRMSAHREPLLRAVADFERAILLIQYGRGASFEILWDRHPERTLLALERGEALPEREAGWLYRLWIEPDRRPMVRCQRESGVAFVVG